MEGSSVSSFIQTNNQQMAKLVREEGYITKFLEGSNRRKQPAGCSLYHLKDTELDPGLAAKLAPFINSYRPHSAKPEPKQLREEGYELVRCESFTDELKEVYWELKGYYPEENPELEKEG